MYAYEGDFGFGLDSVLPMVKNVVSVLYINSIELCSFPNHKNGLFCYFYFRSFYLIVVNFLVYEYFDIPKKEFRF